MSDVAQLDRARDRLVVVTAMRDVAGFVPVYRRMIEALDILPRAVIIGENDSTDGTREALFAWGGVRILVQETGAPLYPRTATAARAAHLACVRNRVLDYAMTVGGWDWALMLDAQKYVAPAVLRSLLAAQCDVVAPLITHGAHAYFYDTWCFRAPGGVPYGHDVRIGPGVRAADAVGGVMLVRRAVLEAGCRLAGTDGRDCDSVPFCAAARAKRFGVWAHHGVAAHACATPEEMAALVSADAEQRTAAAG